MAPIPPPREHGFTQSTPVPLYWAKWGKPGGTPLLVLHGGPGAHHDYLLPQFLDLAHDYELVFYDQRGGGKSKTDDRTPIGWKEHVADLQSVVAELEIDPLSLIGYSWGGLLAMLFAIEATAGRSSPVPKRMVLVDPAPVNSTYRQAFETEFSRRQASADVAALRSQLSASGLRERDLDAYRQRNFELGVAGYFADPSAAHDLTPFRVTGRVQQSVWESLNQFDLLARGQLDTVKVPTLIVHGRQDPIPLQSSRDAAAVLGAQLVELDHSGHVPYVEQREALFASIRLFLDATN